MRTIIKSNRGRPRTNKSSRDLGTPELQNKRKHFTTLEPFDLCFKRNIINKKQHNAGMKLRWLYSIFFGIPNVSAHDIDHIAGRGQQKYSNKWYEQRELEYNIAAQELKDMGCYQMLIDVCICQKPLPFMTKIMPKLKQSLEYKYDINYNEVLKFREALDYLDDLWNSTVNNRYH